VARLDLAPRILGTLRRLVGASSVVHLHTPNPLMMAALCGCPSRAPLVVTWHSDVVKQRVRGLFLRPVEEAVLRRAALVLSDSAGYVAGSPALLRHRDKVEVLPLGLDLHPYSHPSMRALHLAEGLRREHGSPLWLAVGRLVYYKGFHVAIDALAHAPGRLLVVGTGPEEQRLRARARERGVADRVVWLGQASAEILQAAYQAATALWFPSNARSEGFGQVQVEAMASGCPVVNTAIPHSGAPWVSLDGISGLTVPMEDPAALAGASRRLLDPVLRARLSNGARVRAVTEFDQELMARRSLDLYGRATERASRRV
jgi:rhamnosyl/mannosyltransferase